MFDNKSIKLIYVAIKCTKNVFEDIKYYLSNQNNNFA